MKFTFFLPLLMKCAIALAPHARVGSFKTKSSLVGDMWSPAQGLARRFKQCVHNANPEEYWFDQRIHTLGNVGFFGGLHAAMAPVSTKLIDVFAYDGIEVREVVSNKLREFVDDKSQVVDLCCGVGTSTRALREVFPDSVSITGMDTSTEMVAMAKFLSAHIESAKRDLMFGFLKLKEHQNKMCGSTMFQLGNAEDTKLPSKAYDLVTVMYAFHEVPHAGRDKILAEARRLLRPRGKLVIVDISSDYTPSKSMLQGEPYVLEYQTSIHEQLRNAPGFMAPQHSNLVKDNVDMWVLERAALF